MTSIKIQLQNAKNPIDPDCKFTLELVKSRLRLTAIVCKIGIQSRSVEMIVKLLKSGMNIARLSVSQTTYAYAIETIKNIRAAVKLYSQDQGFEYPLAIALDTNGPQIRTGMLKGGIGVSLNLEKDSLIRLTTSRDHIDAGTEEMIFVDFKDIVECVKPGQQIYLDHGSISLVVLEVEVSTIFCQIRNSGTIGSKTSVNLPGISLDLPLLTDKDKADLKFGAEQNVDFIFASSTQNEEMVHCIRSYLGEKGHNIRIIAKIETVEGVDNFDEILQAADGILVGRGSLGIEMPLEKMFLGQKAMILKSNQRGKPVICSSQMLDSMVANPRPTRAEVADVANAVLDGTDCVTLSKSTANGLFPIDSINTMDKICREAEAALWHHRMFSDLVSPLHDLDAANSIGVAAVEASIRCNATAIIVITTSGKSAFLISKFRPRCPIIAITRHSQTARHSQIYRGVIPLVFPDQPAKDWAKDIDLRVRFGLNFANKKNLIDAGDPIVIVAGWKEGSGYTNTLRIIYAFIEDVK